MARRTAAVGAGGVASPDDAILRVIGGHRWRGGADGGEYRVLGVAAARILTKRLTTGLRKTTRPRFLRWWDALPGPPGWGRAEEGVGKGSPTYVYNPVKCKEW